MRTNPAFSIGQLVQVGLVGKGRIRDIVPGVVEVGGTERETWVYSVEPQDGGDFHTEIAQRDLTSVESPLQAKHREIAERIEHHAAEGRELATKAANSRTNGNEMEAELAAAVSQAHSLASIATTLGESSLGVEM
jgi:3-deoxy-D-arabino-heptulosonate 7-phosphate (DAHP) synthase class II